MWSLKQYWIGDKKLNILCYFNDWISGIEYQRGSRWEFAQSTLYVLQPPNSVNPGTSTSGYSGVNRSGMTMGIQDLETIWW